MAGRFLYVQLVAAVVRHDLPRSVGIIPCLKVCESREHVDESHDVFPVSSCTLVTFFRHALSFD